MVFRRSIFVFFSIFLEPQGKRKAYKCVFEIWFGLKTAQNKQTTMLDINTSSNINTSGNNWILPLSIRRYTHSNRIFNSIEYASNASLQHDFRVRKNIRSTLNKKSTEKSTPKLQTNKNKGKNNGLKCKRVIYIYLYIRGSFCVLVPFDRKLYGQSGWLLHIRCGGWVEARKRDGKNG